MEENKNVVSLNLWCELETRCASAFECALRFVCVCVCWGGVGVGGGE